MSDPAEQQPVDEAAELGIAAAQAIEACGSDMLATIKALSEQHARAGARRRLGEGEPWLPARAPSAEAQGIVIGN